MGSVAWMISLSNSTYNSERIGRNERSPGERDKIIVAQKQEKPTTPMAGAAPGVCIKTPSVYMTSAKLKPVLKCKAPAKLAGAPRGK